MAKKDEAPSTEGKTKCQFCGKWVTSEQALEHEAGSYCLALREKGWDTEDLKAHRASLTVDVVPVTEDGREYIKVAVLGRICRKNSIPVARLVRAFGKDRGIDPPLHDKFRPYYVGKARYVHPDCGEEWGLKFLRGLSGRSAGVNGAAATTEALAQELENS